MSNGNWAAYMRNKTKNALANYTSDKLEEVLRECANAARKGRWSYTYESELTELDQNKLFYLGYNVKDISGCSYRYVIDWVGQDD